VEPMIPPRPGSADRFRSRLDLSEKNQRNERAFLLGASAVLAAGLIIAMIRPDFQSEDLPMRSPPKTELLPIKSMDGTRIFWVF